MATQIFKRSVKRKRPGKLTKDFTTKLQMQSAKETFQVFSLFCFASFKGKSKENQRKHRFLLSGAGGRGIGVLLSLE